jgi:hypothetical protein
MVSVYCRKKKNNNNKEAQWYGVFQMFLGSLGTVSKIRMLLWLQQKNHKG